MDRELLRQLNEITDMWVNTHQLWLAKKSILPPSYEMTWAEDAQTGVQEPA